MNTRRSLVNWQSIGILFGLILTLFAPTYGQTHNWTRVNPGGSAFSTVEAGPSGVVLAGSDLSGVFKISPFNLSMLIL